MEKVNSGLDWQVNQMFQRKENCICFRKGNWRAITSLSRIHRILFRVRFERSWRYNPDKKRSIKFYIIMYLRGGFSLLQKRQVP